MSDGPHKSLPLDARWKRAAEKVAIRSFTTIELVDEIANALSKDMPRKSIDALKAVLQPAGQSRLFLDDQTAALDAISRARPGCAVTIALVECATEACLRPMTSAQALNFSIAEAAKETFDARARAIEEHYHRKEGQKAATFMRERCVAIRSGCDFGAMAVQLLAPSAERLASPRSRRRTGLSDGPALSR